MTARDTATGERRAAKRDINDGPSAKDDGRAVFMMGKAARPVTRRPVLFSFWRAHAHANRAKAAKDRAGSAMPARRPGV